MRPARGRRARPAQHPRRARRRRNPRRHPTRLSFAAGGSVTQIFVAKGQAVKQGDRLAALDTRDTETQGHSVRVSDYTVVIARRMGVEDPELTEIRRGALLHDVGKIGISDAVLRKPGKLSPEEWIEMRKHPEIGYRILSGIKFLEKSLPIVIAHQERYDGSGYPRGLKGEEIPLGARIFAVVDTLDAMTSDRPYRRALSYETARQEIIRNSGIQFDPSVVEVFLSIPPDDWKAVHGRNPDRRDPARAS